MQGQVLGRETEGVGVVVEGSGGKGGVEVDSGVIEGVEVVGEEKEGSVEEEEGVTGRTGQDI